MNVSSSLNFYNCMILHLYAAIAYRKQSIVPLDLNIQSAALERRALVAVNYISFSALNLVIKLID